MRSASRRGIGKEGVLPGGLKVRRRADQLHAQLPSEPASEDPLRTMDWVTLFALAVNEENAAGGRIVTAPTNGAAGIIPAVLHYYDRFVPAPTTTASSGSCSPPARSACSSRRTPRSPAPRSAARARSARPARWPPAGLAEVIGGTPEQVENAAEIGMEHNLGLTCDPVGGLVQIPCIERNAIGLGQGDHRRPDGAARRRPHHVVAWTRPSRRCARPARDMNDKYKETARGGLAVNVVEC